MGIIVRLFFIACLCLVVAYCQWAEESILRTRGWQSRKKSVLRIANGVAVRIQDAPFIVKISLKGRNCTGSIIHKSWVLTAAHCLHKEAPKSIKITAGIDDLDGNSTAQSRIGRMVVIHPKYWEGQISKYDLALMKVDSPFEANDKVNILPLSGEKWPSGPEKLHRACMTAGWGNESEKKGNHLRILNVTAKHGELACKCWKMFHNRRLICLDEKNNRGICDGDSGTALVCKGKGVGVAHAIYTPDSCNVLTFGTIKKDCRLTIGTYMYICPQLNWIRSYVKTVPAMPVSCGKPRILSSMFLVIILIALLI